jgi:hypothetical protein
MKHKIGVEKISINIHYKENFNCPNIMLFHAINSFMIQLDFINILIGITCSPTRFKSIIPHLSN